MMSFYSYLLGVPSELGTLEDKLKALSAPECCYLHSLHQWRAALAASYLEQWAVQTFNIRFISGGTLNRYSLFQMQRYP